MNDPLKPLRKRFRAWRGRRRLALEAARYHDLFVRRGLSVPTPEEAASLLRRRRDGGTAAKPKGSLRIAAIYHDYNWEDGSLRPALEAFGTVRVFDWRTAGRDFPSGSRAHRDAVGRAILEFLETASREGVDVVFTYLAGGQVAPSTVEAMRRFGAPIVNLALNDKETFVGRIREGLPCGIRDIARHFDLCWTSTEDALEKYVVEGAVPLYLPEGANPAIHRPWPDETFRYDVSFIGQCYGDRPAVIERLRQEGIRVEAFGLGWPNGPLSLEEMVRTWSRSRIVLGFGGVIGHPGTNHLKGRDFEVPMSGALYLTEDCDELPPFYEVGREIVTYADVSELPEKIRELLSDPDRAESIRSAGRERALRNHCWEMRFDKVFRLMGVLE